MKIFQAEAARLLKVSLVTLSRWECDRLHPTWPYQPSVTAYLGYDPFTNPALGRPKGNESLGVAFLTPGSSAHIGLEIRKRRLQMKKTREECAKELGVSVKTLWGWERNRHQPSGLLRSRIVEFIGFDPTLANPTGDV